MGHEKRHNPEMNLVELAQRIKNLRQQRQLTLEDTASRTGLTRSWLSKVENFRITPSLPALAKIAGALGVTLADLVEGLDEKPQLVVIRKGERKEIERDSGISDIQYYSLAHQRANRRMDPFILDIPPKKGRKEALAHEGEEFLLLLKGEVVFEYDEREIALSSGDSLYFDATVQHRLLNRSTRPAQVLCVFLGGNGARDEV